MRKPRLPFWLLVLAWLLFGCAATGAETDCYGFENMVYVEALRCGATYHVNDCSHAITFSADFDACQKTLHTMGCVDMLIKVRNGTLSSLPECRSTLTEAPF